MNLPKWLLKKGVKIPIIIVLSLLLLLVLVNFIVPPIAHHYIEKHSKELCHRTVTLDKLRMNIFTGMVKVEGLKALEENDKDEMLSFDTLEVRINLFKLLKKEVRLNKILLVKPNVSVWQRDSVFNFTDIIDFYAKEDDEPEDTTSSGWTVDLRKIAIVNGEVVYRDLVRRSSFDLRDFSVAVPRLYFGGKSSDIGVAFKLANGGDLALKMIYGLNDNSYNLHININRLAISALKPYVVGFLNLNEFEGDLSTKMVLKGNLNHIMEIVANGSASLSDLKLVMTDNTEVLSVKNVSVDIEQIDLKNNRFSLAGVAIDGANVVYEMKDSSNTFARLLKSQESGTESSADKDNDSQSPAMDLKIKSLTIENSSVNYTDYTLKQKFNMPISSISLQASDVSLTDAFKMKLHAIVGHGGELMANWEGKLKGFEDHKLLLKIQNFKLVDVSPYSVHYTAYPFSAGILSFSSRTVIKNSMLDSRNSLDIYKSKVEKKLKEVKPEYKIPMKAALYVLTDRKGKISMSLPMKGNVSDPEFSLKKIIWKTIGNFLLKVVTAPTDFLASLGAKEDTFSDMSMDLTEKSISSENYDRLNDMLEILKEKPEMKLTVQQTIDEEESRQLYSSVLNLTEDADIKEAVDNSVQRRYQMFQQYFDVQGIASERVQFLPVQNGKTHKGKAVFSFNVSVPMEESLEELDQID